MKKTAIFCAILAVLLVARLFPAAVDASAGQMDIRINGKSAAGKTVTMEAGEKKTLQVYYGGSKISPSRLSFRSSKKSVAGVTKKGVVKAKKKGAATITVTFRKNGQSHKSKVRIKVMDSNTETGTTDVLLRVNGKTFPAKIYNNAAGKKLLSQIPSAFSMEELNGNEKYVYMDEKYETSAKTPGTIHAGDIKLYGADCLVVFYKTFSTPYSYTDIGYVEDAAGFAAAVGVGSVEIAFELPAS